MTADNMRAWLIARYPSSKTWKHKVVHMPNEQVVAIYKRLSASEPEPKERAS